MEATSMLPSARSLTRRKMLGALCALGIPSEVLAQAAAAPISPDQFRGMELMDGDFAIQTSQLALARSRAPAILNFAQLEINEQMGIAAALGTRPGGIPIRPDQAGIVHRLASMAPGRAFDRAYVMGQIAGHREFLALNASYSGNGFDFQGNSVARSALPTIQMHLSMLSRLQRI
jgi:putative membrane protein